MISGCVGGCNDPWAGTGVSDSGAVCTSAMAVGQGFGVCVHLDRFRFGTAPVLTCSFRTYPVPSSTYSGSFVWPVSSHLPLTMGRWTQYDEVRRARMGQFFCVF